MSGGWAQSAGFTSLDDFGGLTGTTIAPSATINTLGSWVSLGTLKTDCVAAKLGIVYNNNGQTDYACQIDIGIGPAGSQVAILNGINMSLQPAGLGQSAAYQHIIPLSTPGGTQLWARTAINKASFTGTIKVSLSPFAAGGFSAGNEFSGIETLGLIGPGRGTVVTSGANQSGTKGSYFLLGTSTRDYAGFFLCFDLAHNATNESGDLIDIAINSTQKVVLPDLFIYQGGVESPSDFEFVPIAVPEGTAFYARAANVAPATTLGVTLYGVFQ